MTFSTSSTQLLQRIFISSVTIAMIANLPQFEVTLLKPPLNGCMVEMLVVYGRALG
jgi:hypothetical protein